MEMAMPARDMRFAPIPMRYRGRKASATDTGMVTMGTMAEGRCQRKIRITIDTITISSTSLCFTVPMAWAMSSERS